MLPRDGQRCLSVSDGSDQGLRGAEGGRGPCDVHARTVGAGGVAPEPFQALRVVALGARRLRNGRATATRWLAVGRRPYELATPFGSLALAGGLLMGGTAPGEQDAAVIEQDVGLVLVVI